MNKAEIRSVMRAMRRVLPESEQEIAASAVDERLAGFEPYRSARVVMAYMACRGELSLKKAIERVWADKKTLVLPRCEADGIMTARRVASLNDLSPGAYGLLEPGASCEIMDPAQIDLILVPGVAFDRAGHRLGQGAGYYDRFLLKTQAVRVGMCHDFALLDHVPAMEHDIPMDYVMTPGSAVAAGNNTTGGPEHG